MLSTADAMLKTPHQFIFSCKANYPFKPHTLTRLGKRKGALAWTTTGGNLLVASWLDKKAINILTNAFKRPETVEWKNGQPVPNFIQAYRNTLNFVDRANAYQPPLPIRAQSVQAHARSVHHHPVSRLRQLVAHLQARQQAAAKQEEGLVPNLLPFADGVAGTSRR